MIHLKRFSTHAKADENVFCRSDLASISSKVRNLLRQIRNYFFRTAKGKF